MASSNKLMIGLLLLAFFLRVYVTNDMVIDHDEYDVYRRYLNDESWLKIVNGNGRLNHHLLALLWAKGAMALFGNTLFSLRWISVCMSVLSVALIYRIGDWLFDKRIGLVAAVLLTFNPYALYYTYNSRGYLAMMFYVLLAYYLATQAVRTSRTLYWVAIAITMGAAIYNHLYAALAWPGLFWLTFIHWRYETSPAPKLWSRTIVTALASLIFTVALILPIVWQSLSGNDIAVEMQQPPVVPSPLWTLKWFSGVQIDGLNPNPLIFYILLGLIFLTVIALFFQYRYRPRFYYLLGWFLLPLILYHFGNWTLFPSILGRPRYFTFVLPFFLLIIALSPFVLAKFTNVFLPAKFVQAIVIIGIIIFWIPPLVAMYERDTVGNWQAVSAYLAQHIQTSDIILCESFGSEWWNNDYHDLNGNCRRSLGYWLDAQQVDTIYPITNFGQATSYYNLSTLDPTTLTRFNRVWTVVWGLPDDVPIDPDLPHWNQLGRTVILPPPASQNILDSATQHIRQLNTLTSNPPTQLVYQIRLAQLASMQGRTNQAVEAWNRVELFSEAATPKVAEYLEIEKQVLDFSPLLLPSEASTEEPSR